MIMDEKIKNSYKVVILTAGKGSRLGNRTTYFNKALLRVGDKAVISHTIDQFPTETEFIIAVGYKGDVVKQYLQIYHSDRKFTFVDVDKYSEPGSGPGYAMIKCKEHLQCPFYFISCDSIIKWKEIWLHNWSDLTQDFQNVNWGGISKIDLSLKKHYCTVSSAIIEKKLDNRGLGAITSVHDKDEKGTEFAFTGVAFIKNYVDFWKKLKYAQPTVNEEIQIAPVVLQFDKVYGLEVDWWDTGNEEGLQKAREHFKGIQNLDKVDEEIYVNEESGFVVKYFHNENMVKYRVERTKKLGDTVPKIISCSKNFYKYEYVKGQDLFKIDNQHEIMKDLLNYTQKNLWTDVKLKNYDELIFDDICKNFYHDKTMSRLNKAHEQLGISDTEHIINNREVPSLKYMFERMNWKEICHGIPSNIHGDWNFSNIVFTPEKTFKFLDWRQDFGGLLDYGDRYYDFAKMYACLLWPHNSVKNNQYSINIEDDFWIHIPDTLLKCSNILTKWLFDNGYDVRKANILTSIVWLNMSPLHEFPLNKHLYFYGKLHLYESLIGKKYE